MIDIDRLAADILTGIVSDAPKALPLFAVHGRALTAAEMVRLYRKPWQKTSALFDLIGGRGDYAVGHDFAREVERYGPVFRLPDHPAPQACVVNMAIVWPDVHGYEMVQWYGDRDAVTEMVAHLPRREGIPKHQRIDTGLTADERAHFAGRFWAWWPDVKTRWSDIQSEFDRIRDNLDLLQSESYIHDQNKPVTRATRIALAQSDLRVGDALAALYEAESAAAMAHLERAMHLSNSYGWGSITGFCEQVTDHNHYVEMLVPTVDMYEPH